MIISHCRRLRSVNSGQLLINLCLGLLGLYIVFIPALYSTSVLPLCVVLSGLLHYFVLVSFLAMASEATVLYLELVKVFTSGQDTVVLKVIIITWGKNVITALQHVIDFISSNPSVFCWVLFGS